MDGSVLIGWVIQNKTLKAEDLRCSAPLTRLRTRIMHDHFNPKSRHMLDLCKHDS